MIRKVEPGEWLKPTQRRPSKLHLVDKDDDIDDSPLKDGLKDAGREDDKAAASKDAPSKVLSPKESAPVPTTGNPQSKIKKPFGRSNNREYSPIPKSSGDHMLFLLSTACVAALGLFFTIVCGATGRNIIDTEKAARAMRMNLLAPMLVCVGALAWLHFFLSFYIAWLRFWTGHHQGADVSVRQRRLQVVFPSVSQALGDIATIPSSSIKSVQFLENLGAALKQLNVYSTMLCVLFLAIHVRSREIGVDVSLLARLSGYASVCGRC